MIIRTVRKEDLISSKKISAVAYEFSSDLKVDSADYKYTEDILWGAYDGDTYDNPGKLIAQMSVIPYVMNFDSNWVNASGIAGVASLPEYRHMGAVRKIFERIFKSMLEKEQIFSLLYPFKHAYYNKFGYETVNYTKEITFDFKFTTQFERNTRAHLVEETCPEQANELYNEFALKHNTAFNKNNRLPVNPYKDKRYGYIYFRENGTPGGYFVFEPKNEDGKRIMRISELIYKTPSDLRGIFGFMSVFEADYQKAQMTNLPSDEDFSLMFNNFYDVSAKLKFTGMARVIDVKKAFEKMKYPCGEGHFSIKIYDDFAAFNSGVYDISYKNGIPVVVKKEGGEVDMETTARTLARLVLGTDGIFSHLMQCDPSLKVYGNEKILEQVFIKKPIWLGDFF